MSFSVSFFTVRMLAVSGYFVTSSPADSVAALTPHSPLVYHVQDIN